MFDVFDKGIRSVVMLALLAALGGVVFGLYGFAKGKVVSKVYGEKLAALTNEYESLRNRYNRAVEKSAVTELVVKDGSITVQVRGSDRVLHSIPTKLDPKREIHVDFVVRESRLFIRRLYDDETPPKDGLLIELQDGPELGRLDWKDPALARGITVYRGDLSDGRWIVTSSGNGALDLTKSRTKVKLEPPPNVHRFDQMKKEISDQVDAVGPIDVISAWAKEG